MAFENYFPDEIKQFSDASVGDNQIISYNILKKIGHTLHYM